MMTILDNLQSGLGRKTQCFMAWMAIALVLGLVQLDLRSHRYEPPDPVSHLNSFRERNAVHPNAPPGPEQAQPASHQAIAFVNVNVVPMDRGQILAGQTVVVKDGRIAEAGPAGKIKVPAAAWRIDGRGRYLMPGLADMHVHLQDDHEQDNRTLFQLFLANGVTTILNLYGTPHHLGLRERIRRGGLLGPTLYTSGPFVSNAPVSTPTVEEVEHAVVAQKRAGYDFIKIHGDFSRGAYRRLFEVARREGIRVIGHAPRNLGIAVMLEERQHAVAHAEEYLYAYFYFHQDKALEHADLETKRRFIANQASRIPAIAQATANASVWVIPNLTAYKGIGRQAQDIESVLKRPEVKYVPPSIAAGWQPERNTYVRRFKNTEAVWRFQQSYELLEKLVQGLRDAGVRMLAGTDTPVPSVVPGFSIHDELEDLVAAGLTPYEALRTATVHAAEFLGTTDQAGTVTVGKRADLVLLDADPLADVRHTRRIRAVAVGGRLLARDTLDEILNGAQARAAGRLK